MKKGFTLIELLGVITLLGLLSLIVVPVVDKLIKDNQNKVYELQVSNIENGAKNWAAENIFSLPETGYIDKTICDLERAGFIETDIKNPKTDKLFYKDSYVRITKTDHGYEYDYVESGNSLSCNNIICVPATSKTVTTGNVPTGNYEAGDEYICEVKDNTKYHFFVLSTEDQKVNLMMDSNITNEGVAIKSTSVIEKCKNSDGCRSFIPWIASEKSTVSENIGIIKKGPVTALAFLEKATKDWTNIPNLNETHIDYWHTINPSKGYESVNLTGKARLAKRVEIDNLFIDKNYDITSATSMSDCDLDMLPVWATNYMYNYDENKNDAYSIAPNIPGRTHVNYLGAYWLMDSSGNDYQDVAYDVGFDSGFCWATNAWTEFATPEINSPVDLYTGIRPVISISKVNISN